MPESVQRLADEVERLKLGTDQLATQVESLAGALETLSHVQREQAVLKAQVEAQPSTEDVQETVDTAKTEVRLEVRTVRRLTRAVIVMVAIVAFLAVAGFRSYIGYRNETYHRCLDRNTSSKIVRDQIDKGTQQALESPALTATQKASAKQQSETIKKAFPISATCSNLKFHWGAP